MTKHIGLIGYPLKHSLSPDFQQAALDHYGLDIRYEKWETQSEELPSVINRLRQSQNLGANITVPYKESVLPLIDGVDDLAREIGAVNTITKKDNKLMGFNTDVYGFIHALQDDASFKPLKKRALILGAGGAARAVSFVLLREGVSYLAIFNRTSARTKALVGSLIAYCTLRGLQTEVVSVPLQDVELREVAHNCQLIVNCTTMGMKYSSDEGRSPLTIDAITEDVLVYDLVYNPLETPLLRMAKAADAKIIGGLSMLVYQGAASFKLWTGREAPIDIMYTTARQALL